MVYYSKAARTIGLEFKLLEKRNQKEKAKNLTQEDNTMKKIFTVLVVALAVSLAFTGCASKKAKEKGPKVYRVDIGSVLGGPIELSEEPKEINITSLFPREKLPVAGETVRVMWSLRSDVEVQKINVSLGEDSGEYILGENIPADKECYFAVNIPVKEDMTGSVYASVWTTEPAVLETSYLDAK